MVLTSRERVLCALNHEEPDRVPLFIGTSGATTLLAPAHENLKSYLGVKSETRLLSRSLQYVHMDEAILERLGSDGRVLIPRQAPSKFDVGDYNREYMDEWGTKWQRRPGVAYYEALDPPLANATIYELETYPWPDMAHPSRFAGLADEARTARSRRCTATASACASSAASPRSTPTCAG